MRPVRCQEIGYRTAAVPSNIPSVIGRCFASCDDCDPVGGKKSSNVEISVRFTISSIDPAVWLELSSILVQ